MGISAFVWNIATMASALVNSFFHLLFTRSFMGVGEAGFTSIAQGYLADITPKEKHARILSAFGLALPVGGALGYLLGGLLGAHYGWRVAFLLVGVPGALLSMLVFFLNDPAKNVLFGPAPSARSYLVLLQNKKYVFICLSQAMATFVLGGLAAWMPTYIHRHFGLGVAKANAIFGALVIVSGVIGTFFGGQFADRLLKKTKHAYMYTAAGSFVFSLPFALAALLTNNFTVAMVMFFFAVALAFSQTGPLAGAVAGTTQQHVRSMAFALNIFIIHLLGDAFSPLIIGRLSDLYSLRLALIFCFAAFAPAVLFALLAAKQD